MPSDAADCFRHAAIAGRSSRHRGAIQKAAIERWEKDIRALEALDKTEATDQECVLFLGSSSIRRWKNLAKDMQPWHAIRRGYGGARFSDLAVFIDRLTKPHTPAATVIFVANDISGDKQKDKQPEEVIELIQYIVGRVKQHAPGKPIFLIEITPTSKRWPVWPEIRKVNRLMSDLCQQDPLLHVIKTTDLYLKAASRTTICLSTTSCI